MREFGGKMPGWGYAESVLIYGNLAVVTPGGNNCIVALDKGTGKPVWSSQGFNAGAQYSSCYAFEHEGVPMIVNGTREGVVCVEPKGGRVLWSNPFSARNTANCPTPVFADDMLYLFGERGGKVGLAPCSSQGMQMKGAFSVQGKGPSWAHPVVIGGRFYVRYDTNLYCYEVRANTAP